MTARRHCPHCHRTADFDVEYDEGKRPLFFMAKLVCEHCGHEFAIESVLRVCMACGKKFPHAIHKRVNNEKTFAHTCLSCGHYSEVWSDDKG